MTIRTTCQAVAAAGAVLVGVAMAAPAASAAETPVVTPQAVPASLPAGTLFLQQGITPSRSIVGDVYSPDTSDVRAALLSRTGVVTLLPLVGSAVSSTAVSTNSVGDIAGAVSGSSGREIPVVWPAAGGGPRAVPVPVELDDAGQARGWQVRRVTSHGHALLATPGSPEATLLWDGTTTRSIADVTRGFASRAVDLNDRGQLLLDDLADSADAATWTPGAGLTILHPAVEDSTAFVTRINDRGEVGGGSGDPGDTDEAHAAIWDPEGRLHLLGEGGIITDINEHGDAVGTGCVPGDFRQCTLFLFHNGRVAAKTDTWGIYISRPRWNAPHVNSHGDVVAGFSPSGVVSRHDW